MIKIHKAEEKDDNGETRQVIKVECVLPPYQLACKVASTPARFDLTAEGPGEITDLLQFIEDVQGRLQTRLESFAKDEREHKLPDLNT